MGKEGAIPHLARVLRLVGELMSTRARSLGAAGAVLDGYHRDTRGVVNGNFSPKAKANSMFAPT
jgi:regulator of RNase E activity RraA